jgi:glutamyl-tRNA(gln) amidotransferase subunit A
MAGRDDKDMTTLPDYFEIQKTAGEQLKIGLINDAMGDGVDEEVRAGVNSFADKLRARGHAVENVDMPSLKYALAIYYIVVPAEISSNLARYDGVRYGYRTEGAKTLAELYGRSRNEGFMTENKRRIMIGSYVLSSGFFDAYYLKAQKARTILINEFSKLFEQYDFLLLPTAPTPAFAIGENTSDPVKMYLADVMTVPPSLAGLPAISVPAGISAGGLPIGAQLVGSMKSDAKLIALAGDVEDDNE